MPLDLSPLSSCSSGEASLAVCLQQLTEHVRLAVCLQQLTQHVRLLASTGMCVKCIVASRALQQTVYDI